MTKIVFSLLHAESTEVLSTCISNFLLFADDSDFLVINSTNPCASNFDVACTRIFITQGAPRAAHGQGLLCAHIDNWKFACNMLQGAEQDVLFTTMASNSLFFRNYDKSAIVKSMSIADCKPLSEHAGWQYDVIRNSSSFKRSFGESFVHNQIEGFTTWFTSWKLISSAVDHLDYSSHKLAKEICLEEILPLSVLARENHPSTNICSMKWSQSRKGARFVTLEDLFVAAQSLPMHLCQYKWFDRQLDSIATRAVSDNILSKMLGDVFRYADTSCDAARFQLGSAFLNQLSLPKTKLELGNYRFNGSIGQRLSRKTLRLNEGLGVSPFVFFESIPEGFSSELSIRISGTTAVIFSTSEAGTVKVNVDAYLDLKFYAVLYLPIPNEVTGLYLTDFECVNKENGGRNREFSNQEMLLNLAILEDSGKYECITPDYNSFESELLKPFAHYRVKAPEKKNLRCFGIPIIPNTGFRFSIRYDSNASTQTKD